MILLVRVICLSLFCLANSAQAALVRYDIEAEITANSNYAQLGDLNLSVGDKINFTYLIEDSIPKVTEPYYAYREGNVLGGSVSAGLWNGTLGGQEENYVSMWDDQPLGSRFFDGFWISSGVSGNPINGFMPWYAGFVLFSYEDMSESAISGLQLPTSISLQEFEAIAKGTMVFRKDTTYASFDLNIVNIKPSTIFFIPEPNSLALFSLAILSFALVKRKMTKTS